MAERSVGDSTWELLDQLDNDESSIRTSDQKAKELCKCLEDLKEYHDEVSRLCLI